MAEDKTDGRDPFNDRYTTSQETAESELTDSSKTSKSTEISKTNSTEKSEETDKASGASEDSKTVRERKNVNMYLPKEKVEELQLRYAELNVAYQQQHGEEMPKNDVFYPAVIESALEDRDLKDVLEL